MRRKKFKNDEERATYVAQEIDKLCKKYNCTIKVKSQIQVNALPKVDKPQKAN